MFFSSQPNIDVQKSILFLESQFREGIGDNYTLALITYALSSVGSPEAENALNMQTERAEQKGNLWDPCEVDGPFIL